MQIVDATLIPYQLPLTTPWASAAGRWQERRGWLIRITDQSGRSGHGDAAPLPASGTETLPQARSWLHSRLARLAGETPAQARTQLPPPGNHPAARCGLEAALLDLQSKQQAVPLCQLLGGSPGRVIRLNSMIGGLGPQTGSRAAAAIAAGYTTLKLKLGLAPVDTELALLQQLCERLPPGVKLRLDANRAWQNAEALELIEQLNPLPIESLEEPLRHPIGTTLKRLQERARFDLALDESLPGYIQEQQLQAIPVRRIIIKPTCQGGLIPALTLIRQAHQSGIRCVITSTLESSAGIWPLCQLAAAADDLTTPTTHGLATSDWFSRDLGEPPLPVDGQLTLGADPGTGFVPDLGPEDARA